MITVSADFQCDECKATGKAKLPVRIRGVVVRGRVRAEALLGEGIPKGWRWDVRRSLVRLPNQNPTDTLVLLCSKHPAPDEGMKARK